LRAYLDTINQSSIPQPRPNPGIWGWSILTRLTWTTLRARWIERPSGWGWQVVWRGSRVDDTWWCGC